MSHESDGLAGRQLPGFPEQVSVDLVIVTSVYFVSLLVLIRDIILLADILPVKVTYMQRFLEVYVSIQQI